MKDNQAAEALEKSIDSLLDEYFTEEAPEAVEAAPEGDEIEKSIDIAKDAEKTADAAVNKAPKAQKDEARGAGRPKQVSDVPQNDMDGRRESEYDASTTENDGKEDEPDETKQSPAIDQSSEGKGRIKSSPKAPKMRPFMKSENGEEVEISEEEYKEFQAFKKSQEEAAKEEELKKAKTEQEDLIKAAVSEAVSGIKSENDELKKSLEESNALIKAMASQPQQPKSITNVSSLEKSQEKIEQDTFSKSEMLDAAEELAKSKQIPAEIVSELEMTGYVYNPQYREAIERKLAGK